MATYFGRQFFFQIFLWQQKGPRRRLSSSSLFHEEMPAVVPAGQPTSSPPTVTALTSPSKILCGPGAALPPLPGGCFPLHWRNPGDELPTTLPQLWGAVWQRAWALLCWGEAQRWETVGEGPGGAGEEHRFIGEEAPGGNGVHFMIYDTSFLFLFLSEQLWLEIP